MTGHQDKERAGAQYLAVRPAEVGQSDADSLRTVVTDTAYSKPEFLLAPGLEDVVKVVRLRSKRVFYRPYEPPTEGPRRSGRPRVYGERFALNDREIWYAPDEES